MKYKIHRKHLIASSFLALSLAVILGFQNCAKKGLKTSQVSSTSMASTSGGGGSSGSGGSDSNASDSFGDNSSNSGTSGFSTGGNGSGTVNGSRGSGSTVTTTSLNTTRDCSISVVGQVPNSQGIYEYPVGTSFNIQVNLSNTVKDRIVNMYWDGTRNVNIRDAFGGLRSSGQGNYDVEARFTKDSSMIYNYPNKNGEYAGLYTRKAVFSDAQGNKVCESQEVKFRLFNKYRGTAACFVIPKLIGKAVYALTSAWTIYFDFAINPPVGGSQDVQFQVLVMNENGTEYFARTEKTFWQWNSVTDEAVPKYANYGYMNVNGFTEDLQNLSYLSASSAVESQKYSNLGSYPYVHLNTPTIYSEWATVYSESGEYVCRTIPMIFRVE